MMVNLDNAPMRRLILISAWGLSLSIALVAASLYRDMLNTPRNVTVSQTRLETLLDLQDVLQQKSLYRAQLTPDFLWLNALKGMAASTDYYTRYTTLDEARAFELKREKQYCGIGVALTLNENGVVEIESVSPNSPAQRASLSAGDVVLSIDGTPLRERDLMRCRTLLMGQSGTSVQITVQRPGGGRESFLVDRQGVIASDVDEPVVLDEGVFYCRIRRFGKGSAATFRSVLEQAEHAGARGLLIDLRGTPGGELAEAVEFCSYLLPAGKKIVSLHGADASTVQTFLSSYGYKNLAIPVCVLVDNMTASAAEICAAALHDHQRAKCIGQPTYGKGVAQTCVGLRDGSQVWLTSARYYTARNYSIHHRGVEPDVYLALTDEQQSTLRDRQIVCARDAHVDDVVNLALENLKEGTAR